MKRAALVLIPLLLVGCLISMDLLNQRHAHLDAALVQAVNRHDTPSVASLLRQGANPDVRDWKTYYCCGGTPFRPLWYEKPLAMLMRRKPREADNYVGPTVLMIATYHGDIAVVQYLLSYGADIRATANPIDYEGFDGEIEALVPPLYETIPLWLTDDGGVKEELKNKDAIVNLLLNRGASANDKVIGSSILHFAVDSGRQSTIVNLVQKGADINARNIVGETPLMSACFNADDFTVKLLLAHGADVNVISNSGDTALAKAQEENNKSVGDNGPKMNTDAIIAMLKRAGAKK